MIVCLLWFAIAPPTVRSVDAEGEPLPPGAAMRLGSVRWADRYPRVFFSPSGSEVLFCPEKRPAELRHLSSGKRLPFPTITRVHQACFDAAGKTLTIHAEKPEPTPPGKPLNSPRLRTWLLRLEWPSLRLLGERTILHTGNGSPYINLSSDGQAMLYAFEREGEVLRMEDPLTGAVRWSSPKGRNRLAHGRISPDGRWVVAHSVLGEVHLLDSKSGKQVDVIRAEAGGSDDGIFGLEASLNGTILYVVTHSWVGRYDLNRRKCTHQRTVPPWTRLVRSPDGKELLGCHPLAEIVLDTSDLSTLKSTRSTRRAWPVAFSPDGKLLASLNQERLELREVRTGRLLFDVAGHRSSVDTLQFCPDGEELATSDGSGQVLLWNHATGTVRRRLDLPLQVTALAYRPDGKELALAGRSHHAGKRRSTLHVWNRDAVKPHLQFEAQAGHIARIAYSSKCDRLISIDQDGLICWWATETHKRLTASYWIRGFRNTFLAIKQSDVQFGREDGRLITLSPDKPEPLQKVWGELSECRYLPARSRILRVTREEVTWVDPDRGEPIKGPPLPSVSQGPRHAYREISPLGNFLVFTPQEHAVGQLFDLELQVPLTDLPLEGFESGAWAFSADERWFAIAEQNGSVLLYDVPLLRLRRILGPKFLHVNGSPEVLQATPEGIELAGRALLRSGRIEGAARKLIPSLAHEEFAERQTTQRNLFALGPAIVPALLEAEKNATELEIRLRCRRLQREFTSEDHRLWGSPIAMNALLRALKQINSKKMSVILKQLASEVPQSLAGREAIKLLKEKQ